MKNNEEAVLMIIGLLQQIEDIYQHVELSDTDKRRIRAHIPTFEVDSDFNPGF